MANTVLNGHKILKKKICLLVPFMYSVNVRLFIKVVCFVPGIIFSIRETIMYKLDALMKIMVKLENTAIEQTQKLIEIVAVKERDRGHEAV